jgi:oligopeptide transport system substrate-binding protein
VDARAEPVQAEPAGFAARRRQRGSGLPRGERQGSAVGISAPKSTDVQVDLDSPAADFAAIASSPTLAIVPSTIDTKSAVLKAGTFVGSGGYVVSALTSSETTLTANTHYWAGQPPVGTIHLLADTGSDDPIDLFQGGSIDYTGVSAGDATWIVYDKTLGPSLRVEPSPSVEYYGFNTSKAPFNDVHVRRAFQMGINWDRLVALSGNALTAASTGMVPDGVPGHSATDFGPKFDLATAKAELVKAGYPAGAGFPAITIVTPDGYLVAGVVRQLHDNLGIDVVVEQMDGSDYYDMLLTDPPAMWDMGWVADYPGANDFLGLLLGSGQTNNFSRWSNADFEAAITKALAASDGTAMQAAFDEAQAVVAEQAPVIPVSYGANYTLAAKGLLGALPNSQGLVRYAGLAWSSGS